MRNKVMGMLVASAMVLTGCSSIPHAETEVKAEAAVSNLSHEMKKAVPAADPGAIFRSVCAQIVEEVDDGIGMQVTACIPAASVQNGPPDLLMIVSKAHFSEDRLRTIWIGSSIGIAAQTIEKLPVANAPHVKAVMIDMAEKERKSLEELTLCTVPMEEAEALSKRHQSGEIKGWSEVYQSSNCNKQTPAKSQK
jgi:hypothetical protein